MKRYLSKMNKKMKPKVHWFLTNEGMSLIICSIVLIGAFVFVFNNKVEDMNWIDYTVFFTVIAALLVNFITIFLNKLILVYFEDDMKLTNDYNTLTKRYTDKNFIRYSNAPADGVSEKNLKVLAKLKSIPSGDNLCVKLPVLYISNLYKKKITISDDKENMYQLPDLVQEEFGHLFKAHASSKIYNQMNIRVEDWEEKSGEFIIKTNRTTYYNSLVTNRAMDYKWRNGITNRDLFGYGPFIPELIDSGMSNHIGFNGFIISKDNKIPLIKRGNKVSIAKGTYATSVAASLKVKYALNENKEFDLNGLYNGIVKEIEDELKIKESELVSFELEKNIIAAYRDMLEGGKPQLLVYVKTTKDEDEIEKDFVKSINKGKKNKSNKGNIEMQMLEDGIKFEWICLDQLKELAISSECVIHKGKKFKMVPSSLASIVMLRNHLESIDEL